MQNSSTNDSKVAPNTGYKTGDQGEELRSPMNEPPKTCCCMFETRCGMQLLTFFYIGQFFLINISYIQYLVPE